MKTKRYLPFSVLALFMLANLSPGLVPFRAPAIHYDKSFASETIALPDGLSTADWAQIRAMLPVQKAYLKASNTGAEDQFGYTVAISDNTMVVGAPAESSSATGVNGDQKDNSAPGSGAAYVFVRTGNAWSQQAYLKASNTEAGDSFGFSVAISGNTIVVGAEIEASGATGVNGDQNDNSAPEAGAAYVFVRANGVWSQQAYLKASNTGTEDFFGSSVAICGNTIVVGAENESSNATGVDGDQNNNSAPASGAAYVFVRKGKIWSQQAYLKGSNTEAYDYFGWSAAISGDTVIVGAYLEDSSATGVNGDQSDDAAPDAGAAYVFVRAGDVWSQQAYLKASNTGEGDHFGFSVAISGDTAVAGAWGEESKATGVNGDQGNNSAPYAGAAYVFARAGGVWSQQAYLKASNTGRNDYFGFSVAISGDTVVVGEPGEDSNATGVNGDQTDKSAIGSGAAYVFVRVCDGWSQQAYLKASNTGTEDEFGFAVAISGITIVAGAYEEDSSATGVHGNQVDNSAPGSGAAYAFSSKNTPRLHLCSQADQDGWILECGGRINKGGTRNNTATTLSLGDNKLKKQYLSILSFTTGDLPDHAAITKVTLKVKQKEIIGGGNPVSAFQGLMFDIKWGFFGPDAWLQITDFQAKASHSYGPFQPALVNGWYTVDLTAASDYINKLDKNGGVTQIRLRFKLDDNNDKIANVLRLYSGDAPLVFRPQLIIEYNVP